MLFKDQVDFVRQHLKKNRLRVFTTVLATTMGCAFLIVLASIGFGLQGSMEREILTDQKLTEIEVYGDPQKKIDVDAIRKMENVRAVVEKTNAQLSANVKFEERTNSVPVNMTEFDNEEKVGSKLSEGRLPQNSDEIVVGYHFAENLLSKAELKEQEKLNEESAENDTTSTKQAKKLGYKESLVGKTISVKLQDYDNDKAINKELTFKVVGVSEKPAKDWLIKNTILFSHELKGEFYNIYKASVKDSKNIKAEKDMFYPEIKVHATNLEAVKGVIAKLKDKGLSVYSVTEQLDDINVIFLAFKVGLIFVGTIAVLIASIGIFNTMTMAVTERTREIGVMKAIGASPKLIQRLFLMESAWIGILGTAIAIVISYGISFLSNWLLPIIIDMATDSKQFQEADIVFSDIPWQLILVASAISIGVALLSGWRPARKATKIDVIQALRQEL
ncbi:ABC transporter permease [Viridibacillus arvi]|jgi:acetoin utilization transport system permease protein|uniref:ABC transporter permease n=1 Tax=Viridibacillus arvi TaxID=263475 RepID=UPI0036EB90AF